ncbi:GIY-YIG nuclease family protein [Lentibacillus cibarius]|uniref:GIY-YIG nuclease family protein n=1 Tax=Lentibacillus cibarius TaxID=2583219 RepID=A0A549YGT3_9BACI|nr:GIY-YIG nuclease family protein [Lentibacillus cibarius]TRM11099.1 GIY-YIG nuclease family protein [Lentibacillus cibarius]
MENNEHIVYILKCGDDTFYTGYTNDLENRVKMHEDGKGAKYTRGRGPFKVVFVEKFSTKEEALQKEYQVKQLPRKEKVKLIKEKLKEVMQYASSEEF